jgi:hypothetical protein
VESEDRAAALGVVEVFLLELLHLDDEIRIPRIARP